MERVSNVISGLGVVLFFGGPAWLFFIALTLPQVEMGVAMFIGGLALLWVGKRLSKLAQRRNFR